MERKVTGSWLKIIRLDNDRRRHVRRIGNSNRFGWRWCAFTLVDAISNQKPPHIQYCNRFFFFRFSFATTLPSGRLASVIMQHGYDFSRMHANVIPCLFDSLDHILRAQHIPPDKFSFNIHIRIHMRFYVRMNWIIISNVCCFFYSHQTKQRWSECVVMIIKFDKYMRKTNNSDLLFVTDYGGNKINALN